MKLDYQRRVSAELLKCGVHRVWIDDRTEIQERISEAVTRDDIRQLIVQRFIRKHQKKGVSRGRARFVSEQKAKGRRSGHGRRKGGKNARTPRKKKWMTKIRALRDELKTLREEKRVTASQYRKYYLRAKGGLYNSRAHLVSNLKVDGVLKEEK